METENLIFYSQKSSTSHHPVNSVQTLTDYLFSR
jgi:hypothetical protein